MERATNINPLSLGRPPLSGEEGEKLRLARLQKEKAEGYQLLVELCGLGEYDAAKQLANKNSRWGYEIVDGVVMEKLD
jgi:hypothetical protein